MFMISRFMYDVAYRSHGYLKIEPYEPKFHISNFYYFRLGAIKEGDKVVQIKEGQLRIPSLGFIKVWSMERFELNDRVLGLFGNLSGLVDKGLQLINSPSIDPGFQGSLALGLKNNTNEPVTMAVGERIGKILFFDCA